MTKQIYDESSIKVLKGLDGVRKRFSMYISHGDEKGVLQCAKEIIDNCFDEVIAGHNNYVYVEFEPKLQRITVIDKGRGIPVGKHKETGISTLTTIFTTLHAGGKLDDKNEAYKYSTGVNGVGSSVVMALASIFEVWTYRDKNWWYQSFARGKVTSKLLKQKPPKEMPNNKCGTIVRFIPDTEIFKKSAMPVVDLRNLLKTYAYLNNNTNVVFSTEKKTDTWKFKDGIADFVAETITKLKVEKFGKPFVHKQEGVAIALQWTDYDEDACKYFVNGANVSQGTHVTGIQRALAESIKKYAGKRSKYRPEDLRTGLIGILNLNLAAPQFDSQTKTRLTSPQASELVYQACLKPLEKFFAVNKSLAKSIITRANEIRDAVSEFKLSKKAATSLKGTQKGKSKLPVTLSACVTKNPKERELFVVEGQSASGTAKSACDKNYQQILPLKGKILNVYKAKSNKIFESKEVLNILLSVGYDPSKKEPFENLRIGKLILLSDADADGNHINLLLSALTQKMLSKLIDKKMLYYVDAGLYTAKCGNETLFGESLKNLQLQAKGKEIKNVVRMKGWGEASPDVLKHIAFNPKTRKLTRIKSVSGAKLKQFVDIMSKDTALRKEILGLG